MHGVILSLVHLRLDFTRARKYTAATPSRARSTGIWTVGLNVALSRRFRASSLWSSRRRDWGLCTPRLPPPPLPHASPVSPHVHLRPRRLVAAVLGQAPPRARRDHPQRAQPASNRRLCRGGGSADPVSPRWGRGEEDWPGRGGIASIFGADPRRRARPRRHGRGGHPPLPLRGAPPLPLAGMRARRMSAEVRTGWTAALEAVARPRRAASTRKSSPVEARPPAAAPPLLGRPASCPAVAALSHPPRYRPAPAGPLLPHLARRRGVPHKHRRRHDARRARRRGCVRSPPPGHPPPALLTPAGYLR